MTGTMLERFEAKVAKGSGCWEWTAYKTLGYGRFKVDGQMQRAHRVAYQLYVGEISNGLKVLHRCDNPGCVNPSHLFLGTQYDNVHDCEAKGRGAHPFGKKNGRAKLTEEQVGMIRTMYAEGVKQVILAAEFNVTQAHISSIVLRQRWTKL